jgi:hypothetical protein
MRYKKCCRCEAENPSNNGYCKPCMREYRREWRARPGNAKKMNDACRRSALKKKYGLTVEEFDRMLAEQGNGCAICGRSDADSRGGRLHVDHCHATGRVRGLLCSACNTAIGKLNDDPELLGRAREYLLA